MNMTSLLRGTHDPSGGYGPSRRHRRPPGRSPKYRSPKYVTKNPDSERDVSGGGAWTGRTQFIKAVQRIYGLP